MLSDRSGRQSDGLPQHAVTRDEVLGWERQLEGRRPEEILGVPPDADWATVRAAFVALARRFHPDAAGAADVELRTRLQNLFIRVTAAYRKLGETRDVNTSSLPREGTAPAVGSQPEGQPGRLPVREPARAPVVRPPQDVESKHRRVAEARQLATQLMAERDTSGAVSALHEVLGLADEAEKRHVRLLLARAYLSGGSWQRYGLALLNEMVRDGEDAEALSLLGALYHREGLLARAEATLRRALAADPAHVEARIQLRAVTETLRKHRARAPDPSKRGILARLLSIGGGQDVRSLQ
jgi:tetratricopeptide (TPR) repeat protein